MQSHIVAENQLTDWGNPALVGFNAMASAISPSTELSSGSCLGLLPSQALDRLAQRRLTAQRLWHCVSMCIKKTKPQRRRFMLFLNDFS